MMLQQCKTCGSKILKQPIANYCLQNLTSCIYCTLGLFIFVLFWWVVFTSGNLPGGLGGGKFTVFLHVAIAIMIYRLKWSPRASCKCEL